LFFLSRHAMKSAPVCSNAFLFPSRTLARATMCMCVLPGNRLTRFRAARVNVDHLVVYLASHVWRHSMSRLAAPHRLPVGETWERFRITGEEGGMVKLYSKHLSHRQQAARSNIFRRWARIKLLSKEIATLRKKREISRDFSGIVLNCEKWRELEK